eukprot:TRINITY_DN71476_c0_g1_i1.p1 TRINITY_DN71476_c0_g1~~TRINITY_DN71476_c0_g1_i1.p1  ORF type:complete len:359 (+),score=123.04 TRINITY_DN71476_c0_g1_i1:83-1078(+)
MPVPGCPQLPGMPLVGLGVWKASEDETAATVYEAIKAGFRHIDAAADYGNEKGVGEGIKKALGDGLCKREDLWVTSKLWCTFHRKEHVAPALERTLSDLGLDYVDLYLVHFPISLEHVPFDKYYPPGWTDKPGNAGIMRLANVPYRETWEAMEAVHGTGKAKNIGVSNLTCQMLMDLLKYAKVKPACNQVESHVYLQQEGLVSWCHAHGIAVCAFSPLGAVSYFALGMADESENSLKDPVVSSIASAHGCTPAQVLLRFQTQRGVVPLTKSTKVERLKENIDLFKFTLSDAEMEQLAKLNRNRRFNDPKHFTRQWGEPGSVLAKLGYPIYD